MLSAGAFIFTVLIATKERKRNLRQTLSTSLSDIARINVDVSRLRKDDKEITPENVSIRKSYNSQRGALVANADFLFKENPKLVTDADCELMALTYDDLGDTKQAQHYWRQAIDLAHKNNTQCHLHLRDYASFLFNNNQCDEARKQFEKALTINMDDTDDDARYVTDTYLIWATLEKNFDNNKEFKRLITNAYEQCKKIKHKQKGTEMKKLIDDVAKAI